MECKNCHKNKNISKFRKNRRKCIKCEYTTRKTYIQKYQKDNKEKLNQYRNIYGKSKNWYYVPVSQRLTEPNSQGYYKPRPKKTKIIKPKIHKELDIFLSFDLLL